MHYQIFKRLIDIFAAIIGILVLTPLVIPVMFLIWRQDKHSPLYIALRVGRGGKLFKMIKLRSMVRNAALSGVDSTSSEDSRITKVGKFIRRYKLDEVPQLWNVLKGEMSLVGPRPNVKNETDLYTKEERKLLTVKPGITDISSIVFSDEGEILKGKSDPDLAYNQLIRPGKSELGLLYIENRNLQLDLKILYYTFLSQIDRRKTLKKISILVSKLGGSKSLSNLTLRNKTLRPTAPPGSNRVVVSRNFNNL